MTSLRAELAPAPGIPDAEAQREPAATTESPRPARRAALPRHDAGRSFRVTLTRAGLLLAPLAIVVGYAAWLLAGLTGGSGHSDPGRYAREGLGALTVLTVGATGIILLVAWWIHQQRYGPLDTLLAQMDALSTGDLAERVDVAASGDLREIAEAINTMAAHLEERQRALVQSEKLATFGSLVAGVAHEINNPLTYVKGRTDLVRLDLQALQEDPLVPQETRQTLAEDLDNLEVALGGIDRIGHIVNTLKGALQPASGKRAEEDVNALVHGCLTLLENDLRGKYHVEKDLRAHLPARCNGGEVSQVVLNLVLNAMQAMPDGGTLALRSHVEAGTVVVEVADRGPGIPPDVQERLFTPFHTTKAKGMGLGLSISKTIIDSQGGRITYETAPGIGTTFRVSLPVATPARRSVAPGPESI